METDGRLFGVRLPVVGALVLVIGLLAGFLVGEIVRGDAPSDDDPTAGSVAVGFSQDMITHHKQAVEMAGLVINNGADVKVRELAFDILTTQQDQVGRMSGWLTEWGQPLVTSGAPMQWMKGATTSGHSHSNDSMANMPGMSMPMSTPAGSNAPLMPGMATTAEMNQLRNARGAATDTLFLQLMIRHHEGGIPMMEYAANPSHVSFAPLRDLAQSMVNTQQGEISLMTDMLTARGAKPLAMN